MRLPCAPLLLLCLFGTFACHGSASPSPKPQEEALLGDRVAAGEDAALEEPPTPQFYGEPPDGKLHLWRLEVGGGHALLLISPAGKSLLLDGGPKDEGPHLIRRLPELLRAPPDWLVLSQPDDLHEGGLGAVIRALGGRSFLEPGLTTGAELEPRLTRILQRRKLAIRFPRMDPLAPTQPVHVDLGPGVEVTVLWPRLPVTPLMAAAAAAAGADPGRDNPLVLRVTHGVVSILLLGDAPPELVRRLMDLGVPLASTLVDLGTRAMDPGLEGLLARLKPRAVFWGAGPAPQAWAGKPTGEGPERDRGVADFSSAQDGELQAVSDGASLELKTEKQPRTVVITVEGAASPPGGALRFVASRHGDYFHRAGCPSVRRIPKRERLIFTSRAQAARHRRPAPDCHP